MILKAGNFIWGNNLKFDVEKLALFQDRLGYHYKHLDFLKAALIHPSFVRVCGVQMEIKIHFQRLEFLGDRFLSAVLGERLFKLFPRRMEGFLSKAYMILARESSLALLAKELSVSDVLVVDSCEIMDSMLGDAMEAIIGSLWLDSDYETASNCVLNLFGDIKEKVLKNFNLVNAKGQLQEFLGERFREIHYDLVKIYGPKHRRKFFISVSIGERLLAEASDFSKHAASEKAATLALQLLRKERGKNFSKNKANEG